MRAFLVGGPPSCHQYLSGTPSMSDYQETLYEGYGQRFRMEKMLHEVRTEHQHLVIFQNPRMGRVMALDGVIQTTEADEFIYHEMLTHVPILAHGLAKRVLIIGGGDGGMLREVAKHATVEHITMVEIDGTVVEMCKEFLPNHSKGAFDDPRLNLVIDDGMRFVANTQEKFDVIISDSTDPIGPGEVLFSENFYQACHRCLNEGGILVTQNGTPFMQMGEVQTTAGRMNGLFADWHFYQAAVPTYIGGAMTFAWGSTNTQYRKLSLDTLRQRFAGSGIVTRYYNPEIHLGAFALPQYVLQALNKPSND
jgi:spermidine synthase